MENGYLDPLNDFFIRYLFGRKGNEDLCCAFINAVLNDAGFPPISKVTIKNPFNLKSERRAKESITDIKAEDDEGKIYDIEVQISGRSSFIKRSIFYGTRMYASQLPEGNDYSTLHSVIVINLLNYEIWPESSRLHSCYMLIDRNDPIRELSDD